MPSYDNKVLTGDQLVYFSGLVKTALAEKASTSAVSAKQDALVFNTAYNASTNKVATMADVPTSINDFMWGYDEEEPTPVGDTLGYFTDIINGITSGDGETVAGSAVKVGEDAQSGDAIMLDAVLNSLSSGKQDALVFNTAYNASSNKVATMSDITTALGGISSFSFEIVQSLPQSNISTSKIYLVAKQTGGTNQVYTEYAYVNNGWEIIGDTAMTIDTLTNQEVATIWSTATATT